jgi:hypothetical protein
LELDIEDDDDDDIYIYIYIYILNLFTDVAPSVFASLREFFGIEPQAYLSAFSIDETLFECGSEGKSGNMFYFTRT